MEGYGWSFDVLIFEDYGPGFWAQKRYQVHGLHGTLWSNDLDEVLAFMRANLQETLTLKAAA